MLADITFLLLDLPRETPVTVLLCCFPAQKSICIAHVFMYHMQAGAHVGRSEDKDLSEGFS